jgi:hypothetical protein
MMIDLLIVISLIAGLGLHPVWYLLLVVIFVYKVYLRMKYGKSYC